MRRREGMEGSAREEGLTSDKATGSSSIVRGEKRGLWAKMQVD